MGCISYGIQSSGNSAMHLQSDTKWKHYGVKASMGMFASWHCICVTFALLTRSAYNNIIWKTFKHVHVTVQVIVNC